MECIDGVDRMNEREEPRLEPGVCIAWEQKLKELPKISGDEELIRKVWEDNDALAYVYIWHCLLSF